ncbi:hypothetical protein [Oceanicoccus sagamiensis]|uniref:Uncharacterized protein n=1 Tax=Oceanicoccus sagamiensis TaxID=716816 RepID=A0A1X9NIW9_9GAMM|nr:hypothetical protein [Oceanicoccus sagamiensis]ARN73933.1 hypothetical protein BST96_07275 [Oceanicoccus sagamiensis]
MKISKQLVLANSVVLVLIFVVFFAWLLGESSKEFLSYLGAQSILALYAAMSLSSGYTLYILYLLFKGSPKGVNLVITWNVFLAMFILIPWLGGMLVNITIMIPIFRLILILKVF